MPVLRDVLLMPQLSPLVNNVAAAMLMVVFFRCVIEFAGWLRARFGLAAQSRQVLQMCLSASIVFWPLFDATEWSWRLNALLPATMLVRIIYKVSYRDWHRQLICQLFDCVADMKLTKAY